MLENITASRQRFENPFSAPNYISAAHTQISSLILWSVHVCLVSLNCLSLTYMSGTERFLYDLCMTNYWKPELWFPIFIFCSLESSAMHLTKIALKLHNSLRHEPSILSSLFNRRVWNALKHSPWTSGWRWTQRVSNFQYRGTKRQFPILSPCWPSVYASCPLSSWLMWSVSLRMLNTPLTANGTRDHGVFKGMYH